MPVRHIMAGGGLMLASLMGSISVPSTAHAQTACNAYVVQRGDTLRGIAQTAYGDDNRYVEVYQLNRATIGNSPNRIEIGITLRLPCRDGSLPSTRRVLPDADTTRLSPEPEPEPAEETPQLQDVPVATLRILTTGDVPPFADAREPGMGLFAELIVRAIETGSPEQTFRIELQPSEEAILIASGEEGAALSFPWYRPDCNRPDLGSAVAARLCRDYAFSQPIYTLPIGLYVLPGSVLASASGPADFAGTRICVPLGYLGPTAGASGLLPQTATVTTGRSLRTCISSLLDRSSSAILANRDMIDTSNRPLVAGLAAEVDLVIAAPRGNPQAVAALDSLEDDIADLTEGAEWSSIVEGQIAVHRRRVALGL
ncbi:MAG: hypothetical protein AAGC92_03535 [Pseudomonadota bacterium]